MRVRCHAFQPSTSPHLLSFPRVPFTTHRCHTLPSSTLPHPLSFPRAPFTTQAKSELQPVLTRSRAHPLSTSACRRFAFLWEFVDPSSPNANSDVVVNVATFCCITFVVVWCEWITSCQSERHVRFISCVAFVVILVLVLPLYLSMRCSQ